jgi:hypothetical protein
MPILTEGGDEDRKAPAAFDVVHLSFHPMLDAAASSVTTLSEQ